MNPAPTNGIERPVNAGDRESAPTVLRWKKGGEIIKNRVILKKNPSYTYK